MKLVEILAKELDAWPSKAVKLTQDDSRSVFGWGNKYVDPACNANGNWYSRDGVDCVMIDCLRIEICRAKDQRTAIVTRAQWEAEKMKQAKPAEQENKWVRHRGGKCPVDGEIMIETRQRSGEVVIEKAQDFWWEHHGNNGDIMAYRMHKPEQHQVSDDDVIGLCVACADEPEQVLAQDRNDPRTMRDRIREIDTTVESLEEERASLIQRLEDEGFKLVRVDAKVAPKEDMADCLNWKRGDVVRSIGDSGGFRVGGLYVLREDCTNKDHSIKIAKDDNGEENGWSDRFFVWHSRP